MKGKVKFFNQGKGFGFVSGDDGKDYFVHISGLKEGTSPDDMQENVSVTFDVVQGDRGPKAENVAVGESSEDSSEEETAEEE